jgi:hypothetical protein
LAGQRIVGADYPNQLIMAQNFRAEAGGNLVKCAEDGAHLLLVKRLSEIVACVCDLQSHAGRLATEVELRPPGRGAGIRYAGCSSAEC